MAKKMGRPPAGRDDVTVKLDRSVVFQAKQVAGIRGVTLAEYLTELFRQPIAKDYLDAIKGIEPKAPKGN